MQTDIQESLSSTPPVFTRREAEAVAANRFGIKAQAKLLVSDKDLNFCLKSDDGQQYILKIANEAESPQAVDFQNSALAHIAANDASLPIPGVIHSNDGRSYVMVKHRNRTHVVRVLTWLKGTVINDEMPNDQLALLLGRMMASIGLVLRDFDHPGSGVYSLWDMKHAHQLRELLSFVDDSAVRDIAVHTLDRFDTNVQPVLERLRTQVIHNDMNPGNVLLDEASPQKISGIIDFGDLVKSPLIMDLAIASAYQLSNGEDPLTGVLPLIGGYHSVCPLEPIEMELLPDLIRTRLITSLLINSYRMTVFPENRDYLMISRKSVLSSLLGLSGYDDKTALERVRLACDSSDTSLN